MRTFYGLAAFALIAAAVALVGVDPAHASDHAQVALGHATHVTPILAGAVAAIRAKITDLTGQIERKSAELKDDTAEADAKRIEREHDDLVRQLDAAKAELATAEAAEVEATRARPAQTGADPAAVAREVLSVERKRQSDIRALGARFKMESTFIEQHAASDTSLEDFRKLVMDKLAEAQERTNGPATGTVEIVVDEGETKRTAVVDAIAARMALASKKPGQKIEVPDHARAYMSMSLVEVAADCIGYRGLLRTGRQVSDVLERAFEKRSFVGLSTGDFPGIFLDAMNKRLLARYQTATPAYRRFSAPYTAVDFKKMNVIRAGDFPVLQPVGQNGEIKSGAFGESKEQFSVSPYAVRVNFTRVMIVNDDLSAIDQILGSAGVRVADWENAQVFAQLNANPTLLTDSTAVFHTNHNNLAAAGTAITIADVGKGRAAMMKQTTLDGIKANFIPATILTGPDKQTEAEQLLTSITPALITSAVPEGLRRLNPVADANLTGNVWYLFADPDVAPTFVYGYLEGFEGPRLSSNEEFGVQGMSAKLEHDFGSAAVDYRGAYKNPGA